MITSFWAAGIGLTILMFAGKAGLVAGSMDLATARLAALAVGYGMIAFLMGVALKIINPLDYFSFFQSFMARGVLVHFFLSLGLTAWGLAVMRAAALGRRVKKTGGILLLVPCPICLSAMLLSCSIASVLAGIDPVKAGLLMAMLFTLGILAAGLLARAQMRRHAQSGRGTLLLGFAMTMVGLYFAVSIIVVPLYSKAKAVVATTGSTAANAPLSPGQAILMVVFVAGLLGLGFLKHRRQSSKNHLTRNTP
jgi:predicted transporter